MNQPVSYTVVLYISFTDYYNKCVDVSYVDQFERNLDSRYRAYFMG